MSSKQLKFKFQILDLFAVTTCAASIAGAFQVDLTLFRQLLFLFLVSICSTGAVIFFRDSKRKPQLVGGASGFVGGLLYLVVVIVFSGFVYEPVTFFHRQALPTWLIDFIPAVFLSVFFGATIGPLLALRFQDRRIPKEFTKAFWFSVVLLSGILILGILAMFDRQNMESRDWLIVALVLSTVFVVHTNDWLTRFRSAEIGHSSQSTSSTEAR